MRQKFLTAENIAALPALYSQDGKGEAAIAHVKWFDPAGSWSWFATEANAILKDGSEVALRDVTDWEQVEDVLFFGLVDGFERELGNFTRNELMSVRRPFGLYIERDIHWTPRPLAEIQNRRAA